MASSSAKRSNKLKNNKKIKYLPLLNSEQKVLKNSPDKTKGALFSPRNTFSAN